MNIIVTVIVILLICTFALSGPPSNKTMEKRLTQQHKRAMHMPVDKKLLRNNISEGVFVLGKQNQKYVCWDINRDGHILIIGGSGSGKSSCYILPFLIANPNSTVFAVDIKGELVKKGRERDDPRICVFSPCDHSGYGFEVFYCLSENSTQQELLETMQTIAYSLIPLGTTKDTFWPISARNMLIGLLLHYYSVGRHDLIACIDAILGSPINDQIYEIVNTENCNSNSYKYLNQFSGMADETLLSVYSNMANSLSCFSDENLRWAFAYASKKASPLTLENKKSIFLSIPEHKLSPWSGPLAMIVNLTLNSLSKRPENSHRIFFLLDELGRIVSSGGAMDGLVDASMTLRSRKVSLCMVVQQIESLQAGFLENQVTTLVGNCNIKIILDASSSKTQKTVCEDWAPKYIQCKQSKSIGGKNHNNSYSFEEVNRISPSDLMALPKNGEAVIITPFGYSMVKKCPYYLDKALKDKADRIKTINERM